MNFRVRSYQSARFSFAHGGKDGHPFPVPLKVYDETIRVLKSAVARARLGQDDRMAALRALDRASRRLERAGTAAACAVSRDRPSAAQQISQP